jgi:hypothetical protein
MFQGGGVAVANDAPRTTYIAPEPWTPNRLFGHAKRRSCLMQLPDHLTDCNDGIIIPGHARSSFEANLLQVPE